MSVDTERPPTSNIMEVSTYSQVIFDQIQSSYPPGSPLSCTYRLTNQVQPHRKDWVGIFKVGWTTTRDYYTFVWASSPSLSDTNRPAVLSVVFEAYYLPKEDGEFYQFCYVDSNGQVRGASTPFCFQSEAAISLEDDILVVTTKDQVEEIEKEKVALIQENNQQKVMIEGLKKEIEEILLELRKTRESVEELRREKSEVSVNSKKMIEEWEQKLRDKEDCYKEKMELLQSVDTLNNKNAMLVAEIKQLSEEVEKLKKEAIIKTTEVEKLQKKLSAAEEQKKEVEAKLEMQVDQIKLLQFDLTSVQRDNEQLKEKLSGALANVDNVNDLRKENQDLKKSLQEIQERQDPEPQVELLNKQKEHTEIQLIQIKQRAERLEVELSEEKHFRMLAQNTLREMEMKMCSMADQFEFEKKKSSKIEMLLTEKESQLDEEANKVQIKEVQLEDLKRVNEELTRKVERLREELNHTHSPVADHQAPINTDQCPICLHSFPHFTRGQLHEHIESHERRCPFCSLSCGSMSQDEFEDHVYSH
ncbi:calcium-binding and coiled-coil domain-containing protein 2 isoform X2 [Erpetoichthys calabaricus]|uniref:C2H2-type domain-containing protein n=1 Tax=Erpetoichthys calabaricus TaxID=27687 RepID=A0A8C4XHS7_ERPCA|nr:calcium-binding and coiled-coil domain-containing protein 2 isoform X2 [Erpetoichthys calabaricus]